MCRMLVMKIRAAFTISVPITILSAAVSFDFSVVMEISGIALSVDLGRPIQIDLHAGLKLGHCQRC